MIKQINPLPFTKEHCDICKMACNIEERFPYLIKSTNDSKDMVICKACLDTALFNSNIIPEDF